MIIILNVGENFNVKENFLEFVILFSNGRFAWKRENLCYITIV